MGAVWRAVRTGATMANVTAVIGCPGRVHEMPAKT
jgi:hypothetical protein